MEERKNDDIGGESRQPAENARVAAEAVSQAPAADIEAPSGGGRPTRPLSGLAEGVLTAIRAGIRLAFFLRPDPARLPSSAGTFAALAIFDVVLHFLLDLARVGPFGHFSFYSFPFAILHIPLMLLAALCIARLAKRSELALVLPLVYIAIGIPLDLLAALYEAAMTYGIIEGSVDPFPADHFYPLYGWWLLASLVTTLRLSKTKWLGRLRSSAIFLAIIVLPLWYLQRGEMWVEENGRGGEGTMPYVCSEEVLYTQPLLLENALEKLLPGRKGTDDLYFVGFAGYGGQDVFLREMEVVEQLFRERFDCAGRSLLLVNNPSTLLKYPIATATALEQTLTRVGEVMNRDEDILFLYLASHGDEKHRLAADLQPLELRDLDPAMVRRMLDDAGIKWRVVVVSACYSGGFIEPLKGPGTLVMTASDATNNSFGCSNDADFTWFGKALFDEELRHTFSFVAAFDRAAAAINRREAKEGETPSHPQIYMGEAIRPRLARLEVRLKELERQRRRQTERGGMAMGAGSTAGTDGG